MKKSLLFVSALLFVYMAKAQTPDIKAVPVKKISGIAHHYSETQKPAGAACDTLKLDSAINLWNAYYYTYPPGGYVFGVSNNNRNGFSIEQDANYYDVSGTDYTYITGGLAYFGVANSNKSADLKKRIVFKIYDDDGGLPGTVLDSTSIKLKNIQADVNNNLFTEFQFATPVPIPANRIFYVSIDHSNFDWVRGIKDSIAIVADGNNDAPAAAFQYFDIPGQGEGWIPVNQFWTSGGDPLNANLFLFPYVVNSSDGSCATLPVSILNFKGSIKNSQALLTWSTGIELNNKGFEIERSKDGKAFTSIGFVNGAGTSTQLKNYSYTDVALSDLAVTTAYYRLKQIDLDGKTSYSNVVPLSLKDILAWKLYPNPLEDKLTIELNLNADEKVSVQIISKDGKLLLNADKGTLLQGQQQLTLNVQNLAGGSYFVRVKAGDKSYIQTIVKQ